MTNSVSGSVRLSAVRPYIGLDASIGCTTVQDRGKKVTDGRSRFNNSNSRSLTVSPVRRRAIATSAVTSNSSLSRILARRNMNAVMPLYGATTAWSLKRIRGRGPGEPCEGDASYQREGHETGHRFDRHDQIRWNAHGRDTAVADRGQGLHTEEVRREEMAEPADAVVLGSVQRRGTARQVSERKDGVYGEIPVHHPRYEP